MGGLIVKRTASQTTGLARIVAAQFLREIRTSFTREEIRTVRQMNASAHYQGLNACATHDVCDANDLMAAAFATLGLVDPVGTEDEGEQEKACDLWNQAWALASPALTADQPVNCYGVIRHHEPSENWWVVVWYDPDGCADRVDFGDSTEDGPEPFPLFDELADAYAAIAELEAR